MNVQEACRRYLQYCITERLVQPSTADKYRDSLETWLVAWFGPKPIEALTREDLSRLRAEMFARKLSIARAYTVLVVIKSMLRYTREILAQPALDPAKIELPRRGRPHVEYLTNFELTRIFQAIPVHTYSGARLRAFIELVLATGMRMGEALALDREIFDAEAREFEIVGKGKKHRTVFVNNRCYYWMKLYLRKRFDSHPALFVTTGTEAERWRREDISRFFINLRDRAVITKKLTPPLLRHTYCTNLRNRGVDISLIKELAGHADIGTTAKYYLGTDNNVLRRVAAAHVRYDTGYPLDEKYGAAMVQE